MADFAWGGHQEKIGSTFTLRENGTISKFDLKIDLVEKGTSKGSFFSSFIERITKALGINLGTLEGYPADKHDRTVTVNCSFDGGDIKRLRELHPTEIRAALDGSAESETAVTDFLLKLRLAPDGEKRASVLAEFVNEQGMEGLGSLKKILGKEDNELEFGSQQQPSQNAPSED